MIWSGSSVGRSDAAGTARIRRRDGGGRSDAADRSRAPASPPRGCERSLRCTPWVAAGKSAAVITCAAHPRSQHAFAAKRRPWTDDRGRDAPGGAPAHDPPSSDPWLARTPTGRGLRPQPAGTRSPRDAATGRQSSSISSSRSCSEPPAPAARRLLRRRTTLSAQNFYPPAAVAVLLIAVAIGARWWDAALILLPVCAPCVHRGCHGPAIAAR